MTHLYRNHPAWEEEWEAVRPRIVSLTFCTKGARAVQRYAPRDEPNAVGAFKAGFDAMKDVGLLVDDSAKWMRLEGTRIDNTRGPFVEIEVRDA